MQKTHRVIYELHILLWNNQHVRVTLDRSGNAAGGLRSDSRTAALIRRSCARSTYGPATR
jgi:hypothetical protein